MIFLILEDQIKKRIRVFETEPALPPLRAYHTPRARYLGHHVDMADKLVINEECGVFRICWLLEEEGDFGATLGDDPKDGPEPTDRDDWEAWKAQKVAREQNPRRDGQGFFWESKGEAQAVLWIVKEALKQERPMPEWAQKALAAGWKPPKGWKA